MRVRETNSERQKFSLPPYIRSASSHLPLFLGSAEVCGQTYQFHRPTGNNPLIVPGYFVFIPCNTANVVV